MRVQLHFEIREDDGRLWFKRYILDDFPCLPNLYDYIEAAGILTSIEEDKDVLETLNSRIYYIAQIVWMKDEKGIYPLLVCMEREEHQEQNKNSNS